MHKKDNPSDNRVVFFTMGIFLNFTYPSLPVAMTGAYHTN